MQQAYCAQKIQTVQFLLRLKRITRIKISNCDFRSLSPLLQNLMASIPLTRIAAFSPFPTFLIANGCHVERHLSSFGIAPENLESEEALVPLQLACEFIDHVADKEGINRFGLEVGSRANVLDVGLFGNILGQSLTLYDLIQKVIRLIPTVDSGCRVWLQKSHTTPDSVHFCLKHEIETGRAQIDAFGLMLFINAVRLVAGEDWRPKRVSLDAAAGETKSFEALSEANMIRPVNHVSFEIPLHLLEQPLKHHRPPANPNPVSENELTTTGPAFDLKGAIHQAIQSGLGTRLPTIEDAASMASMSVSSLQRRLRREGLTYRELVEKMRFQNALDLLEDTTLSIAAISRHLGYSEAANFTHAFRRWTGVSPSQFRLHQKEIPTNS